MIHTLSYTQTVELVNHINKHDLFFDYEYPKHRLVVSLEHSTAPVYIRLPIHFRFPESLMQDKIEITRFAIILIQAGHAAVGFAENEYLIDHKVITTYMVRRKQGKSQIKFLKTKGKSRAGSRIRLANTVRFFERINQRLNIYFDRHRIDRIALSCSRTLIPFLFNSKETCPFDKRDERILSIPKHIQTPNFGVLKKTHQFLLKGNICFETEHQQWIDDLIFLH
jgi:hypothetical protein